MTRITVDANVQKLFLNFTKPLELCNESGLVLGKLIPAASASDAEDSIALTPALNHEELDKDLD